MTTIEQVETVLLDIPTIRGHVLSMTTMTQQSVVLVRLHFSDGSWGIGEGTTIGGMSYGAESPESIKLAIDTYIAPLLLGRDGNNVNGAIGAMDQSIKGNPIARAAVETALWDGLGRRLGVSVAQLFGGPVQQSLPVAWTLASGRSDVDIAEAEEMIDKGRHRIFKLKIGKRPLESDIGHVAAIARAVGTRGEIRVDVNQTWTMAEARRGLGMLVDAGVTLVEQPIKGPFLRELKSLTDSFALAVMADEALQGPGDAMAAAALRGSDVFAVKIGQSGGLKRAEEVAAIGRAADIGLYGGTMLETGVGTAAALQLFSTFERMEWGTELFGPLLLTDEILETPIVYNDFSVHLPTGPGIGVTLDEEKVAFYRRDHARSVHPVAHAR